MAKKFLDIEGLEEVVSHIPQLVQGDNVTLTPDPEHPNKITISSSGGGSSDSPVKWVINEDKSVSLLFSIQGEVTSG